MSEALLYPFPELAPGETMDLVPGLTWLRMPLPFALNHINLWLLRDGDGWTVVDTGYNNDAIRAHWLRILGERLDGRPVKRTIVTHFHPDHIGLAGWFEAEHGARMWVTYGEYAAAHLAWDHAASQDLDRWMDFFVDNGLDEQRAQVMRSRRNEFQRATTYIPLIMRRIADGDRIDIGGNEWRVITGSGHSPEHAALYCAALNVLISGDQVLPRITPNISVWYTEPEGDPLRMFLDSLEKFRALPADVLVLPAHNRPFRGLHARLDYLRDHHAERVEEAFRACDAPRLAIDVVPALFDRALDDHQISFALGETLAHLNYLMGEGRLERVRDKDGLYRFRRIT
jgi:glyoxylase-like metal-dependent hydrolase (beta-lactamase superfamily II)